MTEYVVFFDVDNCLYSASTAISHLMMKRIREYFISLGYSEQDAEKLHSQYYRQYGLAIRGLVKFHQIDPLDFNERCDASLPLEDLLKPDPSIRRLLLDIDRSRVKVWAATNAYITHAERVLKILNLGDLFEGIVYCDYTDPNFTCKPEPEYYDLAMTQAGLDPNTPTDRAKCLFIDDSLSNVKAARNVKWGSCLWFREKLTAEQRAHLVSGEEAKSAAAKPSGSYAEHVKRILEGGDGSDTPGVDGVLSNLHDLRGVWSYIFKDKGSSSGTPAELATSGSIN
ncbi:pyrimidine 5-nucleotidase [Serendipita vermifera]|nr:pyrimidine 5-nucleotidase [Serendipita vermifera]